MAQSLSDVAIKQLSVAERLDLISELWDSIPDSLEELPIPEWHREELDVDSPLRTPIQTEGFPGRKSGRACERRNDPRCTAARG